VPVGKSGSCGRWGQATLESPDFLPAGAAGVDAGAGAAELPLSPEELRDELPLSPEELPESPDEEEAGVEASDLLGAAELLPPLPDPERLSVR
jgi:hypothetical protein